MRTNTITTRSLAAAVAAATLLAACGGGSDDTDEAPADEPAEASADEPSDAVDETPADDAEADEPAADGDDASTDGGDDASTDGGTGSYEPGGSSFRSVNLLDRPVDIYVRTTGLVEAFPIEMGVAPGAVTEFASPPEEGRYVVTEAGAGDPTCVTQCDHFITEQSDPLDGDDPATTLVLYQDPFQDVGTAFAMKEDPNSDSPFGAAIAAPDPTTGLVIPVGVALDEDVFGFRVGYEGIPGCVENVDASSTLVGGNQTVAYAYPGAAASILFFEQPDQDCASPVGGPFEISGGPGTRTFVILTGREGALEATVLDLTGSVEGAPVADAGGDSGEEAAGDIEVPTDRAGLVDAIMTDAPPRVARECVAGVVDALSDDDFQILIENIDSVDLPPGLSAEGQATLATILDCEA